MKNKLSPSFILLALSLIATQCGSKKNTSATENTPALTPSHCINVQVMTENEMSTEWSPARILSSQILSSQCIALHFQYSGCQPGEPLWIWNGDLTANEPIEPQLMVAEAGFCEMLIEARDTFSLAQWEKQAPGKSFQFLLQGEAVSWPPQEP